MEGSKKKRISYRLLAIALTVAMVFTMLPGNLFSAWAEETLRVNVSRSGDGTVGYRLNEEAEVGLFGDGHDQDFFDVDLEQFSRLELHLQAAGDSVVSGVKVGALEKSIPNGQKELSVSLSETDFAADNLTNGQLNVVVSFEAPQAEEPEYTVSAGTLEQVSVSLKGKDESEFQLLDGAEGRTLTEEQLPAAVRISPNTGYELRTVSVNGAAVTDLDENNEFSLTKDMFQGGKAVIAASAELPAQEPQTYGFSSVELVNCDAALTVGGETLTLSTDTKLSAEQLEAGAVLSFTAKEEPGKTYGLSSLLVGGVEKANTADQGKSEFSYTLTAADFNSEGKTTVRAEFTEQAPEQQYDYTLRLSKSGEGSVTIKRKNDTAPVPVTDGMGLNKSDLQATLSFQGAELDGTRYFIAYLKIGENEIEVGEDRQSLSRQLRQNDFSAGSELSIEVRFEPEVRPTLNVGTPTEYQVSVMDAEGNWSPVSGEVELRLPAQIRLTSLEHGFVFRSVKLEKSGEETEDLILSTEMSGELEVELNQTHFDGVSSRSLTAELRKLLTVSLSGETDAVVKADLSHENEDAPYETGREIKASAPLDVLSGDSAQITVEAKDGTKVTDVKVLDGENNEQTVEELSFEGNDASFRLNQIEKDLTIQITTEQLYTIDLTAFDSSLGDVKVELQDGQTELGPDGENKIILLESQVSGAELVFTPKEESGKIYVVSDLKIGSNILRSDSKTEGAVRVSLAQDSFNSDHELSVTGSFRQLFTVQIPKPENGSVTFANQTVGENYQYHAFEGETLTLKATPDSGYTVLAIHYGSDGTNHRLDDNVSVEDETVSLPVTVTGDMTITVVFSEPFTLDSVRFNKTPVAVYDTANQAVRVFGKLSGYSDNVAIQNVYTTYYWSKPVEHLEDTYFNNQHSYYGVTAYKKENKNTKESVKITLLTYNLGRQIYENYGLTATGYYRDADFISLPSDGLYIIIDDEKPIISGTDAYDDQCLTAAPAFEINVKDPADEINPDYGYSGIASIEVSYRIEPDGAYQTLSGDRLSIEYSGVNSKEAKVKFTLPEELDVDGKTISFRIQAKDKAGNEADTASFTTRFNTVAPTINLSFDRTNPAGEDGHVYYPAPDGRTATIVVTDKALSFVGMDGIALNGTAQNAKGETVEWLRQDLEWTPGTDENNNQTYTATIQLPDANYSLTDIRYTNDAGASAVKTINEEFTVDTVAPGGKLVLEENTWTALAAEVLSFRLWKQEAVTLLAETYEDETSGEGPMYYYVQYFAGEAEGEESLLTLEQLTALFAADEGQENKNWQPCNGSITVANDKRFVVYLRVSDKAGNPSYFSTNGIITDAFDVQLELSLENEPENKCEDGLTPIYREDENSSVTVRVHAQDPEVYSGIRTMLCRISLEELSQEELEREEGWTVCTGEPIITEGSYKEMTHDWNGTVTLEKADYNVCGVHVYVKAIDNAGRVSTAAKRFDIDVTAPTIRIDTNNVEPEEAEEGFYTEDVTVNLSYTERSAHFDQEAALSAENLVIKAYDSKDQELELSEGDYTILGWEKSGNPGAPEEDTHILKIAFHRDARYEITANYADRAGNPAQEASFGFTQDTEAPTGTITVAGKGSWDKLLEVLSFGLWSQDESGLTVTAEYDDATSPIRSVAYFKTADVAAKTVEMLEKLPEDSWLPVSGEQVTTLGVERDEKCVVYLRIIDKAGHVTYVGTDGVVVDRTLERKQITLQPSMASGMDASGENPIYGILDNVFVDLKVTDAEPWSGIKEVKYQITGAGQTESRVVYTYDYQRDEGLNSNGGHLVITENGKVTLDQSGVIPGYEELTHAWSTRIPVDKALFNSCDTVVRVDVTDNAGNTSYNEVSLDIDNTRPVIEVSYDTTRNDLAAEKYYTSLTATVTITERDHHFDPAAATAGIVIEGTDGKGAKLPAAGLYTISGWTKVDGETPDSCKHVATITFHKDANYTLNVNYTDRATNSAVEPYADAFTVDATKPTGTLRAASLTDTIWTDIINQLTFNLFSKLTVEISHTAADETSPLASVAYFRTDRNSVYGEGELLALPESSWTAMPGGSLDHGNFLVPANARATVYLRVIDKAGNIRFISTDGFIVDNTQPVVENVAPRVTVTPAQPVNSIYNTDVPIRVRVVDPVVNGSYSGIKQIRYEVRNMGAVTQSGELYNYSGVASSQTELTQAWENASAIVVDRNRNNSNDVEIIVYAVDNAGNENHDSVKIQIDVTAPTISVSYDNNDGDTSFADGTTDAFFRNPRTATIVITERNFDPNAVTITLTNTDGPVPQLSGWRTEGGGGNNDTTRHIATLSYSADGDYSFDIGCVDLAGNRNEGVDYNGLAPQKFTIDLQDPEIRVSYDPAQNEAAQEKDVYFNSVRVATITVTEHNFDASRVKIDLKATDHGAPVAAPVLSAWTHNGNVHTATIRYESDARYSFDVSCADKAGREAADYQEDLFYVDQTPPAVTLEGIVDRSGNSGAGNIGFRLYATDTNFDRFEPVLTGSFFRDGKYVTETIDLSGSISDIEDGKQLVIENLPEDGIYTLTCTVVDKAGNSFREITRYDANGQPYTAEADAATALATFSVNRDGSAFAVDDSTLELLSYYYVQRVQQDVTLIETNANELVEHTLTLNGKELTEGTDYTVELEARDDDSDWYRYIYKVDRDLFEAEGLYVVALSSKDSAGNTTYSDYKQVSDVSEKAQFVVDRTAPVVAISGMETDGRYQTDRQLVTLMPTDDGGALKSIRVILVDEEGNEKRTLVDLKGEEFKEALEANDGVITFTLEEGLYQNVRIICDDWADPSGEENVIYDETFTNISVSTSSFMIFWANRSLRWGVIGGAGGLGGLGILLLLLKKRKKKDEEEVKPAK